jgi:integrase
MDTFGPLPVDAITIGAAKTYVSAMLDERRRLQDLAAAGQTELITINASNGRTWQQRRRALSNSSINKGIVAAMRVLDDAKDDGYLITVSNLNKAKLPEPPPYRGIVEPIQLEYLLRAAAELEELARGLTWEKVRYIRETSHSAVRLGRELGVSDTLVRRVRRGELWNGEPGPRNRNDVARRAPLLFYALAGARVEEGVGVDGRHLDLASHPGTVHIAGTKTSAGDRKVPLVPALRDALIAHRADYQFGARDPMLSTRNGRRNTPSNLTKAVFAPAFERANEALEADGREPIPKLTPHVMRRTFASILYVCEVSQRRAIALMGHADYKITAQVYQQELDLSDESIDALQRVMGCSLEEAYELFRGRSRRTQRPGVVVPKLYGPEKRLATPSPGGERVS